MSSARILNMRAHEILEVVHVFNKFHDHRGSGNQCHRHPELTGCIGQFYIGFITLEHWAQPELEIRTD